MKLNILYLGRCEYEKALSIQYDILEKRQKGEILDTLIIVDKQRGDVTYHGDGQIVGYSIVNLREKGIGIRDFVRKMEYAFINLLKNEFDIKACKDDKHIMVEVLISDLKGDKEAIRIVVDSKPEIINHNIETVPKLYESVRPMAIYERSVDVLKMVKEIDDSILTKSGIMVGLGETEDKAMESVGVSL